MISQRKIIGFCIWFFPFFLASILQLFGILDNMEESLIDFRYKHINPNHRISDKVVIVAIDNESLLNYAQHPDFGRWPWKRSVYLPVLRAIAKQKPKIIFFDILFTEPSKNDANLIQFNKESSIISHTLFLQKGKTDKKFAKYLKKYSIQVKEEKNDCEIGFQIAIPPTNQIGKTSPILHALGNHEFGERMNKEDLLIYKYKETYFPSLPIVALNSFEQILHLKMNSSKLIIQTIYRDMIVPLNQCYYSFHYYSKKEIKNISIVPFYKFHSLFYKGSDTNYQLEGLFHDKIVLIGATATSIFDEKITPFGNLPSVILNATAISNLLKNHFLIKVSSGVSILNGFFLTSLGFYFMFYIHGIVKRTWIPFIVFVMYTFFCIRIFQMDISFNLAFFFVSYPVSFVIALVYINFLEGKENLKLLKETIRLNRQLTIFNENLEEIINERTAQLEEEKKLTDKMMIQLQERNKIIKKRTQKISYMNKKLIRTNDYKNEFLKIVVHDMKTPLLGMKLLADTLFQNELSYVQVKEYSMEISKNAINMLNSINKLLDIDALEKETLLMETTTIDVFELLQNSISLIFPLAQDKNIKIHQKAKRIDFFVDSNETALKKIIDNLLSNAIKHSFQGSTVKIWITGITGKVAEGRKYLKISFYNQGELASLKKVKKLLGSFHLFPKKHIQKENGLSIVHYLAESIECKILVRTTKKDIIINLFVPEFMEIIQEN